MPKVVSNERCHLEMHGRSWRVTIVVPMAVRHIIGKSRLRHDLGTDSLRQANLTKKRYVERFRAQIAAALAQVGDRRRETDREARELADWRDNAMERPWEVTAHDWEDWKRCVTQRASEIRGEGAVWHRDLPLSEGDHEDCTEGWELCPKARTRSERFLRIANGREFPIDALHPKYLESVQGHLKSRTVADDVRALGYLLRWLEHENIAPSIQAMTPRRANAFAKALPALANVEAATANKYLSRLSSYWRWLAKEQDEASVNPWIGTSVKLDERKDHEKERIFYNREVNLLLTGPATQHMHDLMMIGLLTGARLDVIVDLKVGDIQGETILIQARKFEQEDRLVPIHPDLRPVLDRRMAGRKPEDDLFPEWPPVKKAGSLRERSFKASNAFTAYRRSVGVDEQIAGRRRSLVNFHSFRRWCITRLLQARVPVPMIAAIVGHEQSSITLRVYSDGETLAAAAEAIGRLRVPGLNGEPIVEPPGIRVHRSKSRA